MRRIELRRKRVALVTLRSGGEAVRILPPRDAIKTIFYLDGDAQVTIQKQDEPVNQTASAIH
ncbi:hypothetical protein [Roseimaritima ulvae]|uniref:Uncharacterized protein n=1 Tax=Roseimaritima ulvae TaxID=980254 RepID=A0A5B9QMY2_9BACT|nr:hypothetical protein [Roseimaritima ulvae]QEG40447.1 hypothetical protein UC8_24590 [Roseimaritima ulvae]